jgi:hypothetical protein
MRATRNFVHRVSTVVVAAALGMGPVATAADQPQRQDALGQVIVIVIDVSASMGQNHLLEEAKAAATLACALLRGRVALVAFSDQAEVSPTFDLATERAGVMAWIARLNPLGGTKYLQALDAVARLRPRAVVFVSDGAPEEDADAILNRVQDQVRCPLHTIAVQASDQARDILGRMAATSKAGFHVVDQSSNIIDTFLEILGQICRFRHLDMPTGSLVLPDVQGELVAIGLDARPEIAGSAERQPITLGGRPILVARAFRATRGAATVSAPEVAQGKRVIVLRFDQPSIEMKLGSVAIRKDRARVEASSSFRDPDGKPLDPRAGAKLRALFEAVDSEGKVIQRVAAKPSPTAPTLVAALDLPVKEGAAVPFTVRLVSDDLSSGVPFRASESQVVVVDPATAPRAPSVRATSAIQARGGRAGERLTGTATITAQDGTTDERRALLEALKAQPPVIAVRSSLGTVIDAAAQGGSLETQGRVEADRAFVLDFAWISDPNPCTYEIVLPQGEAGGVAYDAARAAARTVAGDVLQLRVVAHRRRNPRVVLLDSYQKPAELRHALVGDEITVELVRGKDHLTPAEFVSLGGGLRARLTQDDGSVEDVPLSLERDRFTTARRTMSRPGRLGVHVAIEGLGVRLDGQIRIAPVALRLVVSEPPAWQVLSMLPQWTTTPLEVSVAGTLEGRPADPEEVDEVIERDGLRVDWALLNGAGEAWAGDHQAAPIRPWRIVPRLERAGEQSLKLDLIDRRGRIHHTMAWKFLVLDSPLKIELAFPSDRGELVPLPTDRSRATWLPRFLLKEVSLVAVVRPTESPIYSSYHLADCRLGDVTAALNKDLGQFEADIKPGGTRECTAILRPYQGRGESTSEPYPELRLVAPVPSLRDFVPCPIRISAVGIAGLLCGLIGYFVQRRRYLRCIETPALKVRLLGATGQARPIVEPNQRGWRWPSPEILVCRRGQGGPWNLCLVYPRRPGTDDALAVVRQHRDGRVSVRARHGLPVLKAGQLCWLTPGKDSLLITDGVRLVLEGGAGASRPREATAPDHGRSASRALQAPASRPTITEPSPEEEMFR